MQYNAQLYEKKQTCLKENKLETLSFWILRQFSIYNVLWANVLLDLLYGPKHSH